MRVRVLPIGGMVRVLPIGGMVRVLPTAGGVLYKALCLYCIRPISTIKYFIILFTGGAG